MTVEVLYDETFQMYLGHHIRFKPSRISSRSLGLKTIKHASKKVRETAYRNNWFPLFGYVIKILGKIVTNLPNVKLIFKSYMCCKTTYTFAINRFI